MQSPGHSYTFWHEQLTGILVAPITIIQGREMVLKLGLI
jgi:hypothetical protein